MMSIVKKIVAAAAVIVASSMFVKASAAEKGEKNVGIQIGYTSSNESAIAGIGFSYAFSSHLRVAPNLQYAFRNNNRDGLLINFDFHVPLNIESGKKVEIYPIAGLNYSCWTSHIAQEMEDTETGDDVTTRKNRFGLNLGAGLGYNVTETLRLSFDARYTLVKGYNTTTLALGIAYRF